MTRLKPLSTVFALISIGFLAGGASPAAAAAAALERIEINGVTVFSSGQVESALELSPGDSPDEAKIRRSRDTILSLYRMHGYEKAEVSAELVRDQPSPHAKPELVLGFFVHEGLPTRISSVDFAIDSGRGADSDRNWRLMKKDLLPKAGLSPGDVYDQEKLSQSRRAVEEAFAAKDYVGAKVSEVRASESQPPAGQTASADHWDALEFHIDPGERVSFGFRGNQVFTSSYLQSLVDEQRVLGLAKDYVGVIRARIEDEYRSEGYAKVQVTAYPQEASERQERHITYVVDEGPRVELESVKFDGNAVFSNEELTQLFFSRASTLLQHDYFVEKDIRKTADLLIETIKSKGYLSAKLVTINTAIVSSLLKGKPRLRASVVVYLYEGDQTLVQNVSFDGMTALALDDAKKFLHVNPGEPLNLYAFSEGIEALKKAYRDRGYLRAQIVNEGTDRVVKYSENNRLADIHLILNEGPQYHLSQIQIEGLSLTREKVVRRELVFRVGEVLSEKDINESETRLKKLGIFSVVTMRVSEDPDKPGYKIVRISIQEGTPGIVAGGPGYRNDLGIRAFGQAAYTNLWGLNHTVSLVANANRRFWNDPHLYYRFVEYQGQLSYVWPWFAGQKDLTFRPTVTSSESEYILFDATTTELDLTWEKLILKTPNLVGLFTYSLERVNQFHTFYPVDNNQLRIGSVTPALRLDLRDNPLAPTSGFFATTSFEYASPWLYSQNGANQQTVNGQLSPATGPIGYYRWQLRTDYFVPLPADVTWYLSFRTGYERNNEMNGEIPLNKQFALGGIGSLRGFGEQALNIQTIQLQGTASYVNYRTQVDFPFTGALKIGPFLDAANLLVDRYSLGELEAGAGVGLHYQSPVGPINFDWAFNLTPPQSGQQTQQFYFSIGVL